MKDETDARPVGLLASASSCMPYPSSLRQSFAACRAITRSAGSSFPVAFRFLNPARRRAMDALYAFLRITDDLADGLGAVTEKRRNLAAWRAGLTAAFAGHFTHPIHPALVNTLSRFAIPPRFLFDAIDGIETDLGPVRMQTFMELYPYCYRVAATVGLACVRIWGVRPGVTAADTDPPAEAAGIAFQLTNILRDLGEDLHRGRGYLPADELTHFRCPPENWCDPAYAEQFRTLMQFQVARARHYYRRGAALVPLLSSDGRAIFNVMQAIYCRLLDEIEHRAYDVFTRRVRIPRWCQLATWVAGWLVKWGVL